MHDRTWPGHRALRCAAAVAVALALGACGADTEGPVEPSAVDPAVVDVDVDPGTADDDFVGAREDVTDVRCEPAETGWTVAGTVTNTTDDAADYRIYSSLLDEQGRTRGVQQIDVVDVAAGEDAPWEGQHDVDGANLECVLRVERIPAEG